MNPSASRRIAAGILLAAFQALILPAPASAADAAPSGPIHLIVPFPPGGGTDTLARVIAKGLDQGLKTSVIVENKAGAGTIIGSEHVARSQPDGNTLLLTTSAHAINASLVRHLPYSVDKSFSPIALIASAPMVLVVRPDSPFKSIKDLAEYAKAHPGQLTYGSSGSGTAVHLAAELFKNIAKVDMTHVPYRGASPAITDLLGGHTDMFFGTSGAVSPMVKAGKLRALAITSAERSPFWTGVPTIAEGGYPTYAADVWYAVFAAAGTPAPIIEQLNKAVNATAQSEEFAKSMGSEGLTPRPITPDALRQYVSQEEVRWGKVIEEGHITTQ
ncbi:Bug family tripartite tricarboxylate transporter substrate binding protein [Bordetella genomosp. 13]|uniref:Bug family tripartite tricarboxylate transporter substrate binding protein n=1 Tax=Bordetella genomosp. 13 TaxID=463040 RepID=UPI0011A8C870|nr:tripartite tricarboxylate transporter substrate binding protein [Bordetella genomosp. 13]